jgi:hypothetical protein
MWNKDHGWLTTVIFKSYYADEDDGGDVDHDVYDDDDNGDDYYFFVSFQEEMAGCTSTAGVSSVIQEAPISLYKQSTKTVVYIDSHQLLKVKFKDQYKEQRNEVVLQIAYEDLQEEDKLPEEFSSKDIQCEVNKFCEKLEVLHGLKWDTRNGWGAPRTTPKAEVLTNIWNMFKHNMFNSYGKAGINSLWKVAKDIVAPPYAMTLLSTGTANANSPLSMSIRIWRKQSSGSDSEDDETVDAGYSLSRETLKRKAKDKSESPESKMAKCDTSDSSSPKSEDEDHEHNYIMMGDPQHHQTDVIAYSDYDYDEDKPVHIHCHLFCEVKSSRLLPRNFEEEQLFIQATTLLHSQKKLYGILIKPVGASVYLFDKKWMDTGILRIVKVKDYNFRANLVLSMKKLFTDFVHIFEEMKIMDHHCDVCSGTPGAISF